MRHRAAWGMVWLLGLIGLAGCNSAPGHGTSMPSTIAPAVLASTAATCGSVGTHDFTATTTLYRADPTALPCVTYAVATCRSASLEILQTAVDTGVDYVLTINGPARQGCDAQLTSTPIGELASSYPPTTTDCNARLDATAVDIFCHDGTYQVPAMVADSQSGTLIPPSPTLPPPPITAPSRPTIASTPAPQRTYPPDGYPTGSNAEVLAVSTGAAGQPVLTLLIPDMNCTAMYFGIAAMPAPSIGPCVVTFDASNGHVGPGTDPGLGTDVNGACPAWPTPQVTFVLDPVPPTTECKPNQSLPTGLHPGAIGWLVEGGGLPYFALPDGTTIRPPAPHSSPRPTPSAAPTR